MKAANEEVKNILESSGQRVDPSKPQLTLSREDLDNMPVIGKGKLQYAKTDLVDIFTKSCLTPKSSCPVNMVL